MKTKVHTNHKTRISLPTSDFRSLPVPIGNVKVGHCFVKVTDIPTILDRYMDVNPRVPNRTKAGVLSGSVIKGIIATLYENPAEMALKNQGIYLLAESVEFKREMGGLGSVTIVLSDAAKHGIINGGHTYAAIIEAIENADELEKEALDKAYVRLHLFQGISEDMVPQIAEGLNRSKQVDDPSLENLKGTFNHIKVVMANTENPGVISYHQGDSGEIDVSDVLTYLSFFNTEKFNERRHPHQFYKKPAASLKMFELEKDDKNSPIGSLINIIPEILWLVDSIRKFTPLAAKNIPFDIGRMKLGKERVGGKKVTLPFLKEVIEHKIPNGWVYPMLAAFRANIEWDKERNTMQWKIPLKTLLPKVITDLVRICITELRDNNMRPEMLGSRESIYRQCYDKIELHLARKGLVEYQNEKEFDLTT